MSWPGGSPAPQLPSAGVAGEAAPGWQKLHPLSPLVSAGRGLIVLAIYGGEGQLNHSKGNALVLLVIVLALTVGAIALGFVRWLVTRWRLDGPVLRIETGLLRRDARQLPLARIQGVDVVRPFLARILGLAELRVRLAGTRAHGRLAYLSERAALDLRARLLAGHHGLDPSTPEPVETPIASVGTGQLVASALLSLPALLAVGLVAFIGVLYVVAGTAVAAGVGGALVAYLLGLGGGIWRRIVELYGFTIGVAPDGIRLKRGLFSTVAETLPLGRVQAVRLVQPLAWRPFGWCRLEVDVAGSPGQEQGTRSGRATKALLPVGHRAMADHIFVSLLGLHQFPLARPPRRAAWKTPLRYHFLAAGCDGRVVAGSTGRFRKVTTWVPLEKVQSVRHSEGPLQRRFRLASVYADAAGRRVRVDFFDRDRAESDALVDQLVQQSREARREASARTAQQAAAGQGAQASHVPPVPPVPSGAATGAIGQPSPPPPSGGGAGWPT